MPKATKTPVVKIGSVKDTEPVYDSLMHFLILFRSMDRQAAERFAKVVKQQRLSQHGPLGLAIAGVLGDFSPN